MGTLHRWSMLAGWHSSCLTCMTGNILLGYSAGTASRDAGSRCVGSSLTVHVSDADA